MTQSIAAAFPVLARLHAAAKQDSRLRFNNLLHPITEAMLERAYRALNRKAATGIDGMDWQSYGVHLAPKLKDLCHRLHNNRYRPQAVNESGYPKKARDTESAELNRQKIGGESPRISGVSEKCHSK
ncbi:MAG: hypothetical protein KUG79_04765 [Pseudomonadales bacterium]|nr:hypothetical protein [Pseudomonadales bacterium]